MVYVPRTQSTAISPSRKKTTDEKYQRDQMQFGQDEMRMALDQAKTAPPTAASNTTYSQKTVQPTTAGARMTPSSPMTGSATYTGGTKTAQNTGGIGNTQLNTGAPTIGGGLNPTGRPGSTDPLVQQAVSDFDRSRINPTGAVDPAVGMQIANPDYSGAASPTESPFDAEQAMADYMEQMLTGAVPTDEAEALIREMIQDKTELGLRDARAGMGRAGLASSGAMQAGESDVRRVAGQQAQQAILDMEERARAEERAMREAGTDMFFRGEDLERGRIADAIQISLIAEQLGVSPEEVLAAMQGGGGGGGSPSPVEQGNPFESSRMGGTTTSPAPAGEASPAPDPTNTRAGFNVPNGATPTGETQEINGETYHYYEVRDRYGQVDPNASGWYTQAPGGA